MVCDTLGLRQLFVTLAAEGWSGRPLNAFFLRSHESMGKSACVGDTYRGWLQSMLSGSFIGKYFALSPAATCSRNRATASAKT